MTANKLLFIQLFLLLATAAMADTARKSPSADNTAVNKRDVSASSSTLTPGDQANGTTNDVEMTRKIRELVMKDKALSSDAHNIKIVTLRGVTTLRGPVDSLEERSKVVGFASQVMGGENFVHDQLEIKTAN